MGNSRRSVGTRPHALPSFWNDAQVIEATKDWEVPLTDQTPVAEIQLARNKLWGDYMKEKRKDSIITKHDRINRIKDMYVGGETEELILKITSISPSDLARLATEGGWIRPAKFLKKNGVSNAVDDARIQKRADALAEAEQSYAPVAEEERDSKPLVLREREEQQRLLALRPSQIGDLPFKDWGKALQLRVGRLALRAVEELERHRDSELIAPETIKSIKAMADIAKQMKPEDMQDEKRPNSLLNREVLLGLVRIPGREEKNANVKEIEA